MPAIRVATALLGTALLLAAPGCRALGVKPEARQPLAALPSIAVERMVEQHNQNAELVQTLEASPSISDRKIGAAQGRMALVRPRDFKLTLSTPTRGVIADVGSNDDEFWIWSSQSEEKEIYVGQYGQGGAVPPDLVFQPEWVVEALGLRMIGPEEANTIKSQQGDAPGTIALVHRRTGQDGRPTIKKTLVDRVTGQIRAHQFYAPDGKTLIAQALPDDYQPLRLESGELIQLPNRIKMTAMPPGQEPMVLNIVMGVSSVRVNQFDPAKKAAIFSVPEYEGYAVVDLNERMTPSGGGRTATYETIPAPPAGARVRLEKPVPLSDRAASKEVRRASSFEPMPLVPDLPLGSAESVPGGIDAVVGARLPRPPGAAGVARAPGLPTQGIGLEP